MSKPIHISDDLHLPMTAATQTFAFIARKGAGKTYAAGKLAEQLLDQQVQVIIMDTVGNWYGLRIAANGKDKGYDIPVFGGLRGDLPLQAQAGDIIADVAVETGRSMILDMSQFSLADRKRFAVTFGERLWKNKKGEQHPSPVTLFIEESQLIVPQQVTGGGDTARMVGIYEEIIRLGRNYGIGAVMISQRPQSVNKEVLNQTECLFVLQINGAQERKALKEWIVHQGMDVSLLDELPSLPVGTAYVWSPQWLGILKKVKIGAKTTFDASATPKVGDRQVRRNPAPLDMADIEQKMAAQIQQAKENNPAELRKEIARLKHDLHLKEGFMAVTAKEPEKIQVVTTEDLLEIHNAKEFVQSVDLSLRARLKELEPVVRSLTAIENRLQAIRVPSKTAYRLPVGMLKEATPSPRGMLKRSPVNGDISGGARRMLIALAQRPQGMNAKQIGVRAGLSSSSGTFGTYLGKLRSMNYIEGEREHIRITEEGLAALGNYDPLPTGRGLLEYWLRDLGQSGAARMLQILAGRAPEAMSAEELGEQAQMSSASGTFGTYLGKLRTLELIEGPRSALRVSGELCE